MTPIASYLNPCSHHHRACHKFRELSTKQKVITCVATIFVVLLTFPLLGIGGLPVFIALTRKFSVKKTIDLEPRFTPLRPLCRNFDKILNLVSDLSKEFQSSNLSNAEKMQLLKSIQSLIQESTHVGKPTLLTEFGRYGTQEILSSSQIERQTRSSGFAIVIPSQHSKLGKMPLFVIHDWKKDGWHYIGEKDQKVKMRWDALSEQDGVLFLSKAFYQPMQTIQDPLEHHSQFKAANFSKSRDQKTPPFYQEKQVGNYCGKHALNAVLGCHHFNIQSWDHERFQGKSNLTTILPKAKEAPGEVSLVMFGHPNFDYPSMKEMVQDSDRFLGSTNKRISHWKAYRLDRSTQEWWCIDSMKQKTINGQETLYQYVVDIEQECTKARNRQPKAYYITGLILWLSFDEKTRNLLQILQKIKSMENLDLDSFENSLLWEQVTMNVKSLLDNSEKNTCYEKIAKSLCFYANFGRFRTSGRDSLVAVIDKWIARIPQLKAKELL